MAFKIFPFLLSVFIAGHVTCGDKCFNDNGQLTNLPAIDESAFVITLQNSTTCVVLCSSPIYNFEKAEEKCKKFSDGSMLSSGNVDALKSVWGTYAIPDVGLWYLAKKDKCQIIQKIPTPTNVEPYSCWPTAGFVCQYPFQYNCAWEIRAEVKGHQIVYAAVFSQNSDADHSKSCTPQIPLAVDCPGANLNPWSSSWGDCSNSCTKKDGDPPMMHETQEVTCNGAKTTVYHKKTCNTRVLCGKDKDDIPYLAIALIVLFIFVLLTVVFVAFFCHLRKKKKARATTANELAKSGKDDDDDASKRAESKKSPKKRKKSAVKTTSFANNRSDETVLLVAAKLNAKTTVAKL